MFDLHQWSESGECNQSLWRQADCRGELFLNEEVNVGFAKYLTEAGFEVLNIAGYKVPFKDVPLLEAHVIRKFLDGLFLPHQGKVDAFYLIGPAWRATLGMIEELEEAYGVPVIHHVPAQSWEMQRLLGFRQPFSVMAG